MADGKEEALDRNGLVTVEEALAYGGTLYDRPEDFNVAIDHVARLLEDAVLLYERKSFGSSAFLAITALEETSKAHVGAFRRDKAGPRPKGGDPLRNHKAKHSMAILPTVFMTDRIIAALGHQRADALHDESQTTSFTNAREAALYCGRGPTGFGSPRTSRHPATDWQNRACCSRNAQ